MRTIVVALGLASVLSGCAAGSKTFYELQTKSSAVERKAEYRALAPACDVRMYVEQRPSSGVYGTEDDSLGAVVVEQTGPKSFVNGVCIKRKDAPLELPASMLVGTVTGGPDLQRFCSGDEMPSCDATEAEKRSYVIDHVTTARVCTWNGRFHAARPFTITLKTENGAALGDYVEFLRIYRNGDLMAAWNRASDRPTADKVVIPGNSLRTGWLAATHPPHLSEMDIRVIPRGDSVTEGVDVTARNDHALIAAKLTQGFGAALGVAVPAGSPERQSFDCLRQQLKRAASVILHRVNAKTEVSPLPTCGSPLVDAGGAQPLSDAYRDLKNQTRSELERLKTDAFKEIAQQREKLIAAVPAQKGKALVELLKAKLTGNHLQLVTKCALEIETVGADAACFRAIQATPGFPAKNLNDFLAAARVLDEDVTTVLRLADEAQLFANRMVEKATEIATDTNKQAQIFNAFALSLADHGEAFEARRNNPPLLAGEQMIPMHYSDKFQGFVLAPWNGVPIRVKDAVGAEFGPATAIPFVDLAGFRYQWAKTRFADFRMAVGGGYVQAENPTTGKLQSAGLPNASVGFGNLKVGVGAVVGKHVGEGANRLRVIVGADLYKLITGSDVEVL